MDWQFNNFIEDKHAFANNLDTLIYIFKSLDDTVYIISLQRHDIVHM